MTTNSVYETKDTSGEAASAPLVVPTIESTGQTNSSGTENTDQNDDMKDNGIFNFMSIERAIGLYKRIHSQGIPDLDWKFYGRRRPDEIVNESETHPDSEQNDETTANIIDKDENELQPTEFDFDDSFSELHVEESIINDSLQLKRRSEPGSERKTNLNDIMSDIIKETTQAENE